MDNKQLELIDLAARVPYGLMVQVRGIDRHCELVSCQEAGVCVYDGYDLHRLVAYRLIKPYLRPMESMTEEEEMAERINSMANVECHEVAPSAELKRLAEVIDESMRKKRGGER